MAIGERFAALLNARGIKQAALAAQYRERAFVRGREFAQETIESHISRLKKSEPVAVRFFFADLTDARDLLDLLAIPEEERGAYLRDANSLLSPEERPLRVVVDLSDSVQWRAFEGLCDDLADKVILAIPERVALVVVESQRQYLIPRCTPEGRVQVEVVANAEQGWARTQKLASDGAIVVSGRRFDPLSRWIAIEQNGREVMLEPTQGIARFASGKPVEDVDPNASLRQLDQQVSDVTPVDPPRELVCTPTRLRRLLSDLTNGKPVYNHKRNHTWDRPAEADAVTRLTWGKALDVTVAATASEWGSFLAARAKGLGAAISTTGGAKDVASHRARVARGGSAPRAILVGAELHLINATTEMRAEMQALHGVQFHDEDQRESGFTRIEKLVATTPWEAWLDDPYMDAAIARIDPDGMDRDELEFARACLLLHGRLKPASAACSKEWRATLTEILRDDPPPVGVRVPTTCDVTVAEQRSGGWESEVFEQLVRMTLLPGAEVDRRAARRGIELLGVPSLAPPRIVRTSSLMALAQTLVAPEGASVEKREAWRKDRRFVLPTAEAMSDMDVLFSLFDRSPARVGDAGATASWRHEPASRELSGLAWTQRTVAMHPDFWREADEILASLWIALRRAVLHADATTLHDGTGILEMGGGLVARIRVTHARTARDEHVEADFWREPRRVEVLEPYNKSKVKVYLDDDLNARPTASILHDVATNAAHIGGYRAQLLASVPRQLFLAMGSARVSITFTGSPWESFGGHRRHDMLATTVAGALHADDEARRSSQDDQ